MKGSLQETKQEKGQGKRSWRHSLSTLEKVTAIALLINALCYFVYVLIVYISAGALVVPLVIIFAVMLVISFGYRIRLLCSAVLSLRYRASGEYWLLHSSGDSHGLCHRSYSGRCGGNRAELPEY